MKLPLPPASSREIERLRKLPRYAGATSDLVGGRELRFVDGASFAAMYREIFERGIYRFECAHDHPRIIDVGANVGLSVIYFKQLYPDAVVTAYEPDPPISACLRANLDVMEIRDVEVREAAAWIADGDVSFLPEGADAGRIAAVPNAAGPFSVRAERLRDRLDTQIDLLKLDMEGAEKMVLADCADRLHWVKRLFVEFHSFLHEPQGLAGIVSVLQLAGFRIWIDNSHGARQPFVHRPKYLEMDLLLNIFAYRD